MYCVFICIVRWTDNPTTAYYLLQWDTYRTLEKLSFEMSNTVLDDECKIPVEKLFNIIGHRKM
jgi:hypothetical protein